MNATAAPFFSDFFSFPLWYHVLNLWYFATNIYVMHVIEIINARLRVPKYWTWLMIYGLIGGLVEHISPYIPACTISVQQEVLLFRIPTIFPGVVSSVYLTLNPNIQTRAKLLGFVLGPVLYFLSSDFFEQDSAASLSWEPFHSKHWWQPHLIGPVLVTIFYWQSGCVVVSKEKNKAT